MHCRLDLLRRQATNDAFLRANCASAEALPLARHAQALAVDTTPPDGGRWMWTQTPPVEGHKGSKVSSGDKTPTGSSGSDKGPKGTSSSDKGPKGATSGDKGSKSATSGDRGPNRGSGGGEELPGGGPDWRISLGVTTAVLAMVNLLLGRQERTPDISFQALVWQLIDPGLVDRIEVVNGTTARVYLRDSALVGERLPPDATLLSRSEGDRGMSLSSGSVGSDGGYGDRGGLGSNGESDGDRRLDPAVEAAVAASKSGGGRSLASFQLRIASVDSFEAKLEAAQEDLGISDDHFVPVTYVQERDLFADFLESSLPTVLLVGIGVLMVARGAVSRMGGPGGPGGIFQVGKAKPVVVRGKGASGAAGEKSTKFSDVAGLDEAKVEVMEFVDFLQNASKYTRLGAKIPKGALLVGPPGTGKTLLAKATAGEANVPFFSMSGSDFIEMFVGVGPSRVRDLFATARASAPCIVFIDEIDAIGRARGRGGFSGGSDERENTLNALLVEMDGFSSSSGVVVLAGTNRADILDKALLRPGRFDRQITIDKPDMRGRFEIFKVHLAPLKLADPTAMATSVAAAAAKAAGTVAKGDAEDAAATAGSAADATATAAGSGPSDTARVNVSVDTSTDTSVNASASDGTDAAGAVGATDTHPSSDSDGMKVDTPLDAIAKKLATLTPGFAGADIANVCNEAALIAARQDQTAVRVVDFEAATDRVMGGLEKRNKVVSKKEREIVAHHEAGHAVAGWFLEHADPLLKVSIVPRGSSALGFAQYLPPDRVLQSRVQLEDFMVMALAGRSAERLIYGSVTSGAENDLERVTRVAYALITRFGMSPTLGTVHFPDAASAAAAGGSQFYKPFAEETAELIDDEARKIVDAAEARCMALLEEKLPEIKALAARLLEREVLKHEDLVELLGERRYGKPVEYDEYVDAFERDRAERTGAGGGPAAAAGDGDGTPGARGEDTGGGGPRAPTGGAPVGLVDEQGREIPWPEGEETPEAGAAGPRGGGARKPPRREKEEELIPELA
ncbi:hypothetical protein MMPV_000988 [Pyropia vietnamensis]